MTADVIFIMGPQGSGKGTQGKRLADTLGFYFWEMGKILREIAAEKTRLSAKVSAMNQGTLLGDDVIIDVLMQRLPFLEHEKGIVFDGVPRRLVQAEALVEYLHGVGRKHIVSIFLDVPREMCIERLLARAKNENRADDTPHAITERFKYYDQMMPPMVDYLKKSTTFFAIDGRPSSDEIEKDINMKLGLR